MSTRQLLPAAMLLLVTVAAAAPADASAATHATAAQAEADATGVIVNGRQLAPAEVTELRTNGIQVNSGNYWYDAVCGAWGYAGGPTMGFLPAEIPFGGPLSADASNGSSGVFVNGRNLPWQDLLVLQTLTGPLAPGRYFIDKHGNGGFEGGPPIINLQEAARRLGNGSWQANISGASGNSDGSSGYVILKDSLGKPATVSY